MAPICGELDCDNLARYGDGLCPTHHERIRLNRGPARSLEPMPPCSIPHCDIEARSRREGAICEPHYQLQYRGIDPTTRIVKPSGRHRIACWVQACPRRAQTKSLCKSHYNLARRGRLEVPAELGVGLNPPCVVDGCGHLASQKKGDLCHTHYCQLRDKGELKDRRAWGKYTSLHPCAIDGCPDPAMARNMCRRHLGRSTEYKLHPEDLARILAIPECENVGCRESATAIDHDHATGEVRGRLCNGCNTALGFLKEDPDRILGLIEYLANPPHRARATAA